MKDRSWYSTFYMFIVTAVFSSIVIGLTRATIDRVEANKQLAFERAVIKAIPELYDPKASNTQIHQQYVDHIAEPTDHSAGAYVYKKNNQVIVYALPVSGKGFWAPIKGIIGIEPDLQTVTGIAFYQQNETPGLGAEITKPEFRNQFKELTLDDGQKAIYFKRAGEPLGDSDVHAITGATQTCIRLEKIINDELVNWREKMKK